MAATSYEIARVDRSTDRRASRFIPNLGRFGGMLGLGVVALGLVLIGVGWNGMAGGGGQVGNVSDLRAQLPWLVSGGILGLALVIVGAALMIVQAGREDRVLLERKLDELVTALSTASRPAAPAAPAAAAGRGTSTAVVTTVVAGPTAYHRTDCRLLDERGNNELLAVDEATGRGLRPCRVCKP